MLIDFLQSDLHLQKKSQVFVGASQGFEEFVQKVSIATFLFVLFFFGIKNAHTLQNHFDEVGEMIDGICVREIHMRV